MAEQSPFVHRFGLEQGRLKPTGFYPQDGDYVFVLGSEYAESHLLATHDRLDISQFLNLTGMGFLRIAAGLIQPEGMPSYREISGHDEGDPPSWVYTATLKHTEILGHPTSTDPVAFHPSLVAEAHEPYEIDPGATLKITVDGGSEQTISFGGGGIFSAAEVATIINATLVGAQAQAQGDTEDQYVQLEATSTGRLASLQVSGGSTYPVFCFTLGRRSRLITGTASDRFYTSGALHLVNGGFTVADVNKLLKQDGSSSVNNGYYLITGVSGPMDATLSPPAELDELTGNFLNSATLDGVYGTRIAYGGDDLSAIIAPDANFTEADSELPVRISGATNPGNNIVNFILSVQSPTLAILQYAVVDEVEGFDAVILGALWKASIRIDDSEVFSTLGERDRKLLTNDIAVNVSKLSGLHKVGFRLELVASDV
jgi:hypothetical protein